MPHPVQNLSTRKIKGIKYITSYSVTRVHKRLNITQLVQF